MKIAVAQFQPRDGDKDYNLSVIDALLLCRFGWGKILNAPPHTS